jgi:hypothetical protein
MRRYLVTALVAEVIGILLLFGWVAVPNYFVNEDSRDRANTLLYCDFSGVVPSLSSDPKINKYSLLDHKAHYLAFCLDCFDNCLPFVIGFPAIAVFALWTIDRRRKEKQSA